jgi:hypothetical protein
MKTIGFAVLGLLVAAVSSTAFAQRPTGPTPPAARAAAAPAAPTAPAPAASASAAPPVDDICKRITCVGEITITGRVQKPFALAEVNRIQPKLTLAELRQPFLDRIEEAVLHDPF